MTKKQPRERRDRDGGREHLIKRFECPNQQQSALSRVRKTALLPPPSSLGLRRHRQRCDDTAIGAAAARHRPPPPPSRAPRTTQHTGTKEGREGRQMEARFEVSRRESPNQRDESERNERVTQSARAARSLASRSLLRCSS